MAERFTPVEGFVTPPGLVKAGAIFEGKPKTGAERSLHTRQFNSVIGNLGHVLSIAKDSEITAGQDWYPEAQDHARRIGHLAAARHGTRIGDNEAIDIGSSMIAIHSPQNEWDRNLMAAHHAALRGYLPPVHGLQYVGSRQHLKKSLPVASGSADPGESVVSGPKLKTYIFYRNIKDPSDPHWVTIDRHAHDVAVGNIISGDNRKLSSPPRYNRLADAYRAAHGRYDADYDLETPGALQAATWTAWKRVKGDRSPGFSFNDYLRETGTGSAYYSL